MYFIPKWNIILKKSILKLEKARSILKMFGSHVAAVPEMEHQIFE